MTPEETQLIQAYGMAFFTYIIEVSGYSLLYGVFGLFFYIYASTFIERGHPGRPGWIMFTASAVSFLLASMNTATIIADFAIVVRTVMIDNADLPLIERVPISNMKLLKATPIGTWTLSLMAIIADAVVVWRAWILSSDLRWVMAAPISLLVVSAVTIITFDGITSSDFTKFTVDSISNLNAASISLSLGSNVFSTAIIAYRLWTHRKFIDKNVGPGQRKSPVQKVLILLVDSGAIYACFQLINLVLGFIPEVVLATSSQGVALQVFGILYYGASSMYPTMIAVIVNNRLSFEETFGFSAGVAGRDARGRGDVESRPATAGHLSFAVPPDRTQGTGSVGTTSPNDSWVPQGDNEKDTLETPDTLLENSYAR